MKPSQVIEIKTLEALANNKDFQDLKGMTENQEKVTSLVQVACATQIQSILDYLDEEYEADKKARQKLKDKLIPM